MIAFSRYAGMLPSCRRLLSLFFDDAAPLLRADAISPPLSSGHAAADDCFDAVAPASFSRATAAS